MFRKITANLVVGLLAPIFFKIRWLPNVYDALFKGVYKYYDFQIDSLNEFLYHVYGDSYFIDYILSILLFMLPFQATKDYYLSRKKARPAFLRKWLTLTAILFGWIIFWGCFSNIWAYPYYYNLIYLVYALSFGLIFITLLYFTVDRYVEKK